MAANTKDRTKELAATLGVDPSDILGYKKYPQGYAVIMKDFKKYIDVQPADLSTSPPGGAGDPGNGGDDGGGDPQPGGPRPVVGPYPVNMPENLKRIYDDPSNFNLQKVRKLAYFLKIPGASALRKLPLLDEIDAWKEAYNASNN